MRTTTIGAMEDAALPRSESTTQRPCAGARRQRALAAAIVAGLGWLAIYAALHGSVAVPRPSRQIDVAPARLDLNLADRAELELLPGVGPQLAQRIEAYRILYGPLPNVDELRKVPGIGPQLLERIRPHVIVTGPARGNTPVVATAVPAKSVPDRRAAKAVGVAGPIDINTASAAELEQLPGIGPKLAQRIIDARTNGPFTAIEELRRVPGIGPKTLEKVRPHVSLGPILSAAQAH